VRAGVLYTPRRWFESTLPYHHPPAPPQQAERLFAEHERRNRLIAPIARAVIGRLVGWSDDATPATRPRVVEQLPLVAFLPRLEG
jgi:hypothetical protein